MNIESAALRTRAAGLRALRRNVITAARAAVRNLDATEREALDRIIEDRLEEALDDEIIPLIDGLEAEAASLAAIGEDGWGAEDRASRSARRVERLL